MIDLIKLYLQAGDGGDGKVAFRREKYVPKGGPSGGMGGNGGRVILRGTSQKSSLQHLAGVKDITAQPGEVGGKQKRTGGKGKDAVIEVPTGTRVWLLAENDISSQRRQRYPLEYLLNRDEVKNQKFYLEKETGNPPPLEIDEVRPILTEGETAGNPELKKQARLLKKQVETTGDKLSDVDFRQLPKHQLLEITDGQEVVVCQGGFGGRGNHSFKSSANTTPLEAEYGTPGERKVVVLEQLLLADVGLVGFPNAGKSTLISVLTEARPKIANYPFTTLEPNLGVMRLGDRELVVADIPGLIEGASEGKGLGHAFLRHVEHCQQLLIVVSLEESMIFDESLDDKQKAQNLVEQLEKIEAELEKYDELLSQKERLVVVNKIDLYSAELQAEIERVFKKLGREVVMISGATQEGLDSLQKHFG